MTTASVQPAPSAFVHLKDASVNYNVHPAMRWAEPLLAYAFAKAGKSVVITCAKNGEHSEYSRHFWKAGDARPAQAVDLRMRDPATAAPWFSPAALASLAAELIAVLNLLAPGGPGGHFTLLVESDHLHLEWNPSGVAANIVGYSFSREVYGT